VMLAGYSAGIALMMWRYERAERLYEWIRRPERYGGHDSEQVIPLLVHRDWYYVDLSVYRYPEYLVTVPETWVHAGFVLLVAATMGVVAGRLAPLRLAPGRLHRAPESAVGEIRRCWRGALRDSPFPWLWALGAGAVAGFAGAILGEAHAMILIVVESEAAWARGGIGGRMGPLWRQWGLLGVADGGWLILWAILLPAATALVIARRRLRRDPVFAERWCLACGYPRPDSNIEAPALRCPECGAAPALARAPRRLRWVWIAIPVTVFALALLAHIKAPSAILTAFGIVDDDLAIVPAGAIIEVRRPRERLWLRLDTASPQAAAAPGASLRVLVQPRKRGAAPPAEYIVALTPGAQFAGTTLDARDGQSIELAVTWPDDFSVASVTLRPGGATSIRAVHPTRAPPFE